MKRVCLFNLPTIANFHGYHIESLDPANYFKENRTWNIRAVAFGESWKLSKLYEAKSIDLLYRANDPAYMHYVNDFVERYRHFDLIVFANYNPIHPEVLFHQLRRPIKVLGFVDDPMSTYVRQLSYLWAFDGAFYVSPSYNDTSYFKDALERWGCAQTYWWPWVPAETEYAETCDSFFNDRDIDLIYVGNYYGPKVDRMVKLKKHFRSRFHLYGRWPLKGYGGMARGLMGKPILWSRVRSITNDERRRLYHRSKIGINMHQSHRMETGNMRMYEVPAHGILMICDKAGLNAHEMIFEPNEEAVFYDSINDAIEKIEYYLDHGEERARIARAGFARVRRDYDWELNLKKVLDWAMHVEKKQH